jgi:phosphatidylserine/phosphatidylglycerophosphate/cardiolipin synthase-like enzyme
MAIAVRVYTSADDVQIVWRPNGPIERCRGFAVYRRVGTGPATVLHTTVGFENAVASLDAAPTGRPSTEWPIQKYLWTDYLVREGDRVRYRVVPMVGRAGKLRRAISQASDWTPSVRVGPPTGSFEVRFNRGIVASQWLARRLPALPGNTPNTKLRTAIEAVGGGLRGFMSGQAREALLRLVADVAGQPHRSLYAALFELSDPELVGALTALGSRLHVVLANGAVKKKGEDENAAARAALNAAGAEVIDRMIAPNRLAHNKFAVVCDTGGKPMTALTGSTNWTATGLCTQSNNVLVVHDRGVAAWFLDAWKRLAAVGSTTPGSLVSANSVIRTGMVDGRTVTAWHTPVTGAVDLADAARRIDAATQGILFLMFSPGNRGTLLNTILARGDPASPTHVPDLYVNGVLNQDPSTVKNPVTLYHRGEPNRLGFDVVLPAAVNDPLAFWRPELLKLAGTHAMIHSKVVVVDPFGDHPVVMTGSHNLGPRASGRNDDNLVIVEGDHQLAEAYAITMMAIYGHYRWRQRLAQGTRWRGLWDSARWQRRYFDDPVLLAEARFWMGGAI